MQLVRFQTIREPLPVRCPSPEGKKGVKILRLASSKSQSRSPHPGQNILHEFLPVLLSRGRTQGKKVTCARVFLQGKEKYPQIHQSMTGNYCRNSTIHVDQKKYMKQGYVRTCIQIHTDTCLTTHMCMGKIIRFLNKYEKNII